MGLHPLEAVTVAVTESARTFVRHYAKSKQEQQEVPARKELVFDEAFHVSKAFLERSMSHSVESIQMLCHAKIPAPPWVALHRVSIPANLCDAAAQIIIQCFGEKEIRQIVGGHEWWQQRVSGGVEGEWIWIKSQEEARRKHEKAKKQPKGSDRQHEKVQENSSATDDQDEYSSQLDEQKCIFYIHGGGYYFGSVDIYRYTIWRYARKIDGRAFALRYRLSPQYPFPCALQDALAAYLYLIRPPPEAKHRPVDPAKMIMAGDSAGGGLSLALLCLLRDMRLPLPAGTVLISPWLDLTHSFPSILQNTNTDIIPPYGFMHKPSVLWPPPPQEIQTEIRGYTSPEAIKERQASESSKSSGLKSLGSLLISPISGTPSSSRSSIKSPTSPAQPNGTKPFLSEPHGARHVFAEEPESLDILQGYHGKDAAADGSKPAGKHGTSADREQQEQVEPDELIRIEVDGKEVELKEQIQMYALNSQLTYPYVSPVLQPSLGGLPDLLIICGDKEVLRDEIIYCAHRAAHPDKYPLRKPLREANNERSALGDTYKPTRVHLQCYDDMPHDLVLFSMAGPAKFAYRAISSFCKAVTAPEAERLPNSLEPLEALNPRSVGEEQFLQDPQAAMFRHGRLMQPPPHKKITPNESKRLQNTIYTPLHPFHRPDYTDNMIRERIALDGTVRSMEPESDLQACCMHPEDVGIIKEGAVRRYLQGKAKWDKKYVEKRIHEKRRRNVKRAAREEAKRLKGKASRHRKKKDSQSNDEQTDEEEVAGTWAHIDGERPPPSSIAARRDTRDALQMAYSLKRYNERSKLNPLTVWSGVHDLVSLFPNRAKSGPDEDEETDSDDSSRSLPNSSSNQSV